MGVMPVKKLIITMSLPMMASMLVQALYNRHSLLLRTEIIAVARLEYCQSDAVVSADWVFPTVNLERFRKIIHQSYFAAASAYFAMRSLAC